MNFHNMDIDLTVFFCHFLLFGCLVLFFLYWDFLVISQKIINLIMNQF